MRAFFGHESPRRLAELATPRAAEDLRRADNGLAGTGYNNGRFSAEGVKRNSQV
jgi:hypothetical protein